MICTEMVEPMIARVDRVEEKVGLTCLKLPEELVLRSAGSSPFGVLTTSSFE